MSRYTIERAVLLEDRDEILALLRRNLSGITDERYLWGYINVPHKDTITLFSRDTQNDAEMVGVSSLFLREAYVDGKSYTAAVTADFAVDTAYRAFGPAYSLQKRLITESAFDGGADFIYSITSENSELLNKRIGFKKLCPYRRFVKILKTDYKENKSVLPQRMPRFVAFFGDILIKLISRETWYIRSRGVQACEVDRFDERFDRLNERRNTSSIIAGKRSADFLRWRFFETTHHKYRVFTVSDKSHDLVGYIVFYVEDNVAYVADMLCAEAQQSFNILFSEFSRHMRGERIGSISMRFVGGYKEKFRAMNFIEDKRGVANLYYYAKEESEFAPLLAAEEHWYFMEADNDI